VVENGVRLLNGTFNPPAFPTPPWSIRLLAQDPSATDPPLRAPLSGSSLRYAGKF